MKKERIKYRFAIKSKEELRDLSHEELLKYIENLQDNLVQEKPPKNSTNSGIPSGKEINTPKRNQSTSRKFTNTLPPISLFAFHPFHKHSSTHFTFCLPLFR